MSFFPVINIAFQRGFHAVTINIWRNLLHKYQIMLALYPIFMNYMTLS
jgi:hypothetical protein